MRNTTLPSASSARGAEAFVHKGTDPKVLRHLAESGIRSKRKLFTRMGLGEPPEFVGRDLSAEIARIFPCEELDNVGTD